MTDETTPPVENSSDAAADQLVLNSPEEAATLKDFALWAGVIVLAVLSAFSPAMRGNFLWDDDRHVESNRDLRDAAGLGDIWTGHWKLLGRTDDQIKQVRDVGTPQYYPFTHTTYWIEAQIFGTENPTVFHVTNMLLHAAGAILLWFVLRELAVPGAWVVAAVFALHPVNVESVAWISERKNVLAGALFFGSILAFLKSPMGLNRTEATGKDRDLTLYFVSVALFTLAVLSKTVACSMPAVVLLLLWWKRGKVSVLDVAWTVPMFVVGLGLSMFTSWIEVHRIGASGPAWDMTFVQHILLAGNAIAFYAGKLLLPLRQTFIYPRWNLDPSRPELWIAPIAVVAVLAVLFALRKRIGRGPITGALIYCGVLVPALGFFSVYPMQFSYVADHFQYLAGPAFIALIVVLLVPVMRKMPTAGPYVVTGIVLAALAVGTAIHSAAFASALQLWSNTAAKNPNSAMVRYNAGVARFNELSEVAAAGDPAEYDAQLAMARTDLEAAVKLDPRHDGAWRMLGDALLSQKNHAEAIAMFDRSLALEAERQSTAKEKSPARESAIDAAMGKARALSELKKPDDAIASYKQAIALLETQRPYASRSKAASSFASIGTLLGQKGDDKGAVDNLQEAIKIDPRVAFAHFEYGNILAKQGKKPDAAAAYAEAIRAQPNYIDARLALGHLMLSVKNLTGAQQQFAAAVRLNPLYPGVKEAAVAFDAAVREYQAAATRPSTTRSTTTPSTTQSTMPATAPITTQPSR